MSLGMFLILFSLPLVCMMVEISKLHGSNRASCCKVLLIVREYQKIVKLKHVNHYFGISALTPCTDLLSVQHCAGYRRTGIREGP
jgi:hypothetical protein